VATSEDPGGGRRDETADGGAELAEDPRFGLLRGEGEPRVGSGDDAVPAWLPASDPCDRPLPSASPREGAEQARLAWPWWPAPGALLPPGSPGWLGRPGTPSRDGAPGGGYYGAPGGGYGVPGGGYGVPPWPLGHPPRPAGHCRAGRWRRPPRGVPGWLALAGVAALVGALVGAALALLAASRAPVTIVEGRFPSESSGASVVGDVQAVLARVLPAVVSIETTGVARGVPFRGAGTGMIIRASGVVLTNNHVISGARSITVTLFGQSVGYPARVIGALPSRDIALLQIEGVGSRLPTVALGDSATVEQGDGVLAIGNALGLAGGPTVTEGIVSATDRSLVTTNESGTLTEHLTGLIQTDAPINPGNSGGPLVDAQAQVIGMNTAVATSPQGNAPAQDVGFAISVDSIKPAIAAILAKAGDR
jgi:S1-C subfamily serine protease